MAEDAPTQTICGPSGTMRVNKYLMPRKIQDNRTKI